jgi:hypothetical protein
MRATTSSHRERDNQLMTMDERICVTDMLGWAVTVEQEDTLKNKTFPLAIYASIYLPMGHLRIKGHRQYTEYNYYFE